MKCKWVCLWLCLLCTMACNRHTNERIADDLTLIQDSGVLVVLTLNSSISYFEYRGAPMGYHYELAEQFAESLGVKLEVKTVKTISELVSKLNQGEGDLIAYGLPVTNAYKDSVSYCGEEFITHQVLVQRKSSKNKITDVTQLAGKTVYALQGRSHSRLKHLNEEIGGGIQIVTINPDSLTQEDLISMVSENKIDYCISDNDIAKLNNTYYGNLNTQLAISYEQKASWAVRKTSTALAEAATRWHNENVTAPAHVASTKRYFERSKKVIHKDEVKFKGGRISPFDNLFKKYANDLDWDWRLLAAIAYTESNFDTLAISWAGAKGLMQLMPRTAKAFGIPDGMEHNPEEGVKAAAKFLQRLNSTFKEIEDKKERTKFVLAAYNSGSRHVYDGMALAEKYGKEKHVWDANVETYMLLKSHEEYYTDPVCKSGYLRGQETVNFVHDVLMRFEKYMSR